MSSPDHRFQEALTALQTGDASRAEAIVKSIVRTHPRHEPARLLLARAQRNQGNNKQAIQSCRDGLKALPDSIGLLIEQALAFRASGRAADAESSYRAVLKRDAGQYLAKHNLANLLQARGALDEAFLLYNEVIAVVPHMAQAHFELGNVLASQGKSTSARKAWLEAVRLMPTLAPAWIKLGPVLHPDELASAIEAFKQSVGVTPTDANAWMVLSTLMTSAGHVDAAAQQARTALSLAPEFALAHFALGLALKASGSYAEAILPLETAVKLSTDPSLVFDAIGLQITCCLLSGQLTQADPLLAQLLSLSKLPHQISYAHHMMAARDFESGLAQEAKAHYLKAMSTSPEDVGHRLSYCAVSHYCGEFDGVQQKELAIKLLGSIPRDLPDQAAQVQATRARNKGDRIRLGFLSGDFRQHSCAYFLGSLFPNLDQSRYELFAYDTSKQADDVTRQFMQWIPIWRHVAHMNTLDLASVIKQDELDVLIDLAGLTEGGRLEALATQPAPVQINWLGFLGTTGHASIQYRLTDGHIDGPQQEGFATEMPLRLNRTYVCYLPHQDAPKVG